MSSPTPSEIDTLALTIERLIAQNEEALAEYDDERPPEDFEDSTSSQLEEIELFS